MLHIFNVNHGQMFTFDVNLAMERVLHLKNALASSQGVHQDKQVMLISGGQALCDDERVCSYAAGTETNPVYLFDKACIEKETLDTCTEYQQDTGFSESIINAISLSPSYQTVETRTRLAIRLNEATRRQVASMKSLVHDEHLMYQGWQAAVANLQDTVSGFKDRVDTMRAQCQKLLQQAKHNVDIMKGLDAVLENLETIPVLPALLKKGTPPGGSDEAFQLSLLRWIETQCKNISLRSMLNECRQKQAYLSEEKCTALLEECHKVEAQTGNERMSEISGINERLAALDHVIITAEQQVKEQTGIAQGFVRNRETARELHNNSSSIDALLTLCESHVTQLRLMHEYEASARDALKKCTHAKNELAANLHTRLRWLYFMQRSVLNADVKLSMFTQQLCYLQRQVSFLGQVKNCPTLYLAAVAEVVRRKLFADNYVKWANKAVSEAQVERDREIVKRKTFQSNMAGHFIQRLFHGFSDKPPSIAKKPLRSFDTKLPSITPEHLNKLQQLLPAYRDILEVPLTEMELSESAHKMKSSITQTTSASMTSQSVSSAVQPKSVNMETLEAPSDSISMATQEKEKGTNSGSFAVVDPANIAHSQPGGFVVTSVEGVTQENFKSGFSGNVMMPATGDEILPERSYSTPEMPGNNNSPRVSLSPDSHSMFAQIGDIVSPESPPDSDFYSIMPGTFTFPQKSPEQKSVEIRRESASSSDKSLLEMSGKYDLSDTKTSSDSFRSARKQPLLITGSPDSNSSTSYQKVDGILSSDDEMFHSFTSDQGKDLKSLRKKLHQMQTEYDNLSEESRQEKEELDALTRKLQEKMAGMEENQRHLEANYERRWEESKSELEDVIKQLENERIERKKAWMEGATLEKNLKESKEICQSHQNRITSLQEELEEKRHNLQALQSTFNEFREHSDKTFSEERQRLVQRLSEEENKYQQERDALKVASTRVEKELTLTRAELFSAEDRIQELETTLSERERKLEESDIHILELETKIQKLEEELTCTQVTFVKAQEENTSLQEKLTESQGTLSKAREQILSLKNILADYETKLDDDRTKDDQIRSLKGNLHQIELEKNEIQLELRSSKEKIEDFRRNLTQLESEMQALRSLAMQDEKSHQEEMEKLQSTHLEEAKSSSERHEEELRILKEEHGEILMKLEEDNRRMLESKEAEWVTRVDKLKNDHRGELDEVEADRLASVASAQQSIEELRTKLKDTHRSLDQEQKEISSLKVTITEEKKTFEEKEASLQQENEELRGKIAAIEGELLECRDVISNLEERRKQVSPPLTLSGLLGTSQLTSSTDEEMESKRSKIDSGISEDVIASFRANEMDCSTSEGGSLDVMTMSMEEHKRAIGVMKKNFEEDKKALQSLFKRREEEAARRRQMVFNSAIQRVTTSKDMEISRLRNLLMSHSQVHPSLTQSMMVPGSQPMVPIPSRSHPSPPASFDGSRSSSSPIVAALPSPSIGSGKDPSSSRDKDRVTVANFQVGDTVLVSYNETYQHFTLLTTSRTLHFVHGESLEKLGISSAATEFKKSMTFATLVEKEYCQARKAQNRFRVPINTKFYRVKVAPVTKKES